MSGLLKYVIYPGLIGAFLTVFIFKYLPKVFAILAKGDAAVGHAFSSSFSAVFMPYVAFFMGDNHDVTLLAVPGIGFVAMSFGYYLYHSDDV